MEYKQLPGMNQSLLKQILKSPQAFKNLQDNMYEESNNDSFRFGTLVDIMLTEPNTDINTLFVIQPDIVIPDSVRPILDEAVKRKHSGDDTLLEIADNIVIDGKTGYCTKMKNETRLARIKVNRWEEYINFKIASEGKTIITQDEYNKALMCKMSVKSNEYLAKYFTSQKDIEIIYKCVIQNTVKDIDFKYELDMVVINHISKTIYPIDIKTIGTSVYQFPSNFWKYRYDFQGAIYYNACYDKFKDLVEKGYSINNFRYIVCEKNSINKPMLYQMSDNTLKLGLKGGIKSEWVHEGVSEAIKRYKWHESNNKWEYPMEYYINGFIEI